MINKSLWRKIQFDVDRYPVVDYKFVPYSTMGIMAKELEMQQMVAMLQSIPKDSPAFNILLIAVFQNSSMHNRDQVVGALLQASQPNPEQQQMQQAQSQMQMKQLEADIAKTLAEAQEEQAKAMLHTAEAAAAQPNELDMKEKLLRLQQGMLNLQKTASDIENRKSETMRNIPEVDHLKSETYLNMANAFKAKIN
jgi:hypothetical protein